MDYYNYLFLKHLKHTNNTKALTSIFKDNWKSFPNRFRKGFQEDVNSFLIDLGKAFPNRFRKGFQEDVNALSI